MVSAVLAIDPDDPLGYDVDIDDDITPDGRSASGVRLVVNEMRHRCMADTLLLIDAPGGFAAYGIDVRRWVGSVMTVEIAEQRGAELAVVFQRDPRIDPTTIKVIVRATPELADFDLAIDVSAYAVTGQPIALTLGVDAVSVALLAGGT